MRWRLRTTGPIQAGGLACLLLIPLAVAAVRGDGFPASRVALSGGGAWLASPSQGLVTLIDGASEQVVGSVRAPGARPGEALSVVQSAASAYVMNATQGTLSRVDGATYESSAPVQFGAPGGALGVYARGRALYVVDGTRRQASVTDPETLQVRSRLSLAAQPGPGQSVVDGRGRLWVVDRAGGGLTWFDRGVKRVRTDVGTTASTLVLVQDQPVLVDTSRGRVGRLDAGGAVRSWSCLDARTGDRAQVLGSAASPWVFAAVPATGTLVMSAVGRDDCDQYVDVGEPGDEFEPLVESGGYVFVPNRSKGRTVVVDVNAGRMVADLPVVKPRSRLELLAKDGFVFYNDLDGDQAGVIRFEGGRWVAGKSLRKYNPAATGTGLLLPGGKQAKAEAGAGAGAGTGKRPGADAPDTGNPGQQPGAPPPPPPPFDPGAPLPDPGSEPPPGGPAPPLPDQPGGPPGGENQTPNPPPTPEAKVTLTIRVTGQGRVTVQPDGGGANSCGPDDTCVTEVPRGSQVSISAPDPASGWTLDRMTGCAESGCTLTMDSAKSVRAVFVPQQADLTVTFGGTGEGTVSGQGLDCGATRCTGSYPVGTRVRLTANPDSQSTFGQWSNCSPRNSPSCTVTVNGDTSVRVTFTRQRDESPPRVTLSGGGATATPTSGASVSLSGGSTRLSMTARGTDGGSDVTRTTINVTHLSWTCRNDAGESQPFEAVGDAAPEASGRESASFTLNVDMCSGGEFPILAKAFFQVQAAATSEGGRAETELFSVNYNE